MIPRRHFIQTLAVGAVATVTASAQTPPPMTQKADGMNYAPKGKPNSVVKAGEFVFAAAFLDHGHINGQCNGLTEAGATVEDSIVGEAAVVGAGAMLRGLSMIGDRVEVAAGTEVVGEKLGGPSV